MKNLKKLFLASFISRSFSIGLLLVGFSITADLQAMKRARSELAEQERKIIFPPNFHNSYAINLMWINCIYD